MVQIPRVSIFNLLQIWLRFKYSYIIIIILLIHHYMKSLMYIQFFKGNHERPILNDIDIRKVIFDKHNVSSSGQFSQLKLKQNKVVPYCISVVT